MSLFMFSTFVGLHAFWPYFGHLNAVFYTETDSRPCVAPAYYLLLFFPHSSYFRILPTLMSRIHLLAVSSSSSPSIFDLIISVPRKNMKYVQGKIIAPTRSPPSSRPATLHVPLSLSFDNRQAQAITQSSDEKLTMCRDPTVKVLHAFSAVFGDEIGFICFKTSH